MADRRVIPSVACAGLAGLLSLALASGCSNSPSSPGCVVETRLSPPSVMAVGDSIPLFPTVFDDCYRGLAWGFNYKSQTPAVATVDEHGMVRAMHPGQTVITVVPVAPSGERGGGLGFYLTVYSSTAPTPRGLHSAIYDPTSARMIVFGGFDGIVGRRDDSWQLSLNPAPAWANLRPSGSTPRPRDSHTAVYDPVRYRMLVFGGGGSEFFDDVFALSLTAAASWSTLLPGGAPPHARRGHMAIYDPSGDRMIVFGGHADLDYFNDAWSLDLTNGPSWKLLAPAGNPPGPCVRGTAIHDPVRARMIVFGGSDGSVSRNDVWALSLTGTPSWTQLVPAAGGPSPRVGHSAIYDPLRDRMVVFGGQDALGYNNEVWTLSLAGTPTWNRLSPVGTGPSGTALTEHSSIYDPVGDRMLVFGWSTNVWALSLSGNPAWTLITPLEGF